MAIDADVKTELDAKLEAFAKKMSAMVGLDGNVAAAAQTMRLMSDDLASKFGCTKEDVVAWCNAKEDAART
jgi:hypothetical protein